MRRARRRYRAPLKDLQAHLGDLNDIATMPATLTALGIDPVRDGPGQDTADRRSILIVRAGTAMDQLREAGPYWR